MLLLNVEIIPTLKDLSPAKIYGKTAIVLDVFRCSSSIITALANGCPEVMPALTPQEALAISAKLVPESYLLAGEIRGLQLSEFSLGNSPREFTRETIKGRRIILSTTNGTKAIRSCKPAKHVLIGSFLNVKSVCSWALGYQKDIVLVCAGTRGSIALEDVLAAGCHVGYLLKASEEIRISELAKTFYYLYSYFEDNLHQVLTSSRSGVQLKKFGCERDVGYCLQMNKFNIAPIFRQNSVKL